jgi:hypothetical protein
MRHAICLLLLLSCPVFAGEPVYNWRSRDDDPDRIHLYRDGKQIGGWCYRAKQYRPFDGQTWGAPVESAPTPPPEKMSNTASAASYSPAPQRRLLRPIKSRVEAGVDAALRGYLEANAAQWAGEAIANALKASPLKLDFRLHLVDLAYSARLFAHVEMGGKLDDKPGSDDFKITKQIMTNGSARFFLSEKAKFAEQLKKEEFSDPVLTAIRFEIVDDDLSAVRVIRLSPTPNWNDEPPPTIAADTRAVLLTTSHRPKDAAEKIPVVVHCSFAYQAQKQGKAFAKTLSFDLYLETLELQSDAYPWKVRNVEYK